MILDGSLSFTPSVQPVPALADKKFDKKKVINNNNCSVSGWGVFNDSKYTSLRKTTTGELPSPEHAAPTQRLSIFYHFNLFKIKFICFFFLMDALIIALIVLRHLKGCFEKTKQIKTIKTKQNKTKQKNKQTKKKNTGERHTCQTHYFFIFTTGCRPVVAGIFDLRAQFHTYIYYVRDNLNLYRP